MEQGKVGSAPYASYTDPPVKYSSQNIVVTTPVSQEIQRSKWSTGLCGCCEDTKSCLCAYFCFPCFFCNLATRFGDSCAYGWCCPHHFVTVARPYLRARHNIVGGLCDDCCVTFCCTQCVLCQISREMDHRGYPKGCMF
ncbi:placenta-specific gene 8 protein-like [Styela clava]|uniref:placenta-specific gene 8 protein-like n=1 Tax=Styela clava TaxID=7725 RepID=UPI00193A6462|nr:placenta-specific gene 8 protein-like [Styela clava]